MSEFKVTVPTFSEYLKNPFIAESKLQLANNNRRNSVSNFLKSRALCSILVPIHSLRLGCGGILKGIRITRKASSHTTSKIRQAALLTFLTPVNFFLGLIQPKLVVQLLNKYKLFEDRPKQEYKDLQDLLQKVKNLSSLPLESFADMKMLGDRILQDFNRQRKKLYLLIGEKQLINLEKFIRDSLKAEIQHRNPTNLAPDSNRSDNHKHPYKDRVKSLSMEIVLNIFSFLSVSQLSSLRTVSKDWKLFAEDRSLYHQFKSLDPSLSKIHDEGFYPLAKHYWNSLIKETKLWPLPELSSTFNKIPDIAGRIRFMKDWCNLHNLEILFSKIHCDWETSSYQSYTLNEKLDFIRKDLGPLRELQKFSIGNMTSFPAEFGQLTNLKHLDLSKNRLVSLFPENAQLMNLETLSLNDNNLAALPSEIGRFTNLETLDLKGNKLTSLPLEIGRLIRVLHLNLADNKLSSLSFEICQLTNLQNLDLIQNELTSLPRVIGQLTNLKILRVDSNELTEVPAEIGLLTNLETLHLRSNKLTSLPPEIGKLKNVTHLDLMSNSLTSLPSEIGKLIKITHLDLMFNRLPLFPYEICQLKNLEYLDLTHNELTSLPSTIGQLTNLKTLRLDSNNLIALPPEIDLLTNLEILLIEINKLTLLPNEICQMTNLKILDLRHNRLTSLPLEILKLKMCEVKTEGNLSRI